MIPKSTQLSNVDKFNHSNWSNFLLLKKRKRKAHALYKKIMSNAFMHINNNVNLREAHKKKHMSPPWSENIVGLFSCLFTFVVILSYFLSLFICFPISYRKCKPPLITSSNQSTKKNQTAYISVPYQCASGHRLAQNPQEKTKGASQRPRASNSASQSTNIWGSSTLLTSYGWAVNFVVENWRGCFLSNLYNGDLISSM